MKTAIIYFLLSLLLLQNSGRIAVMVWFEVNQPEIARTLCENRNRPELHCDGQCILAQKLKAVEQREKQQAAMVAPLLQVVCYIIPDSFTFDFAPVSAQVVNSASFFYTLRTYIAPLANSFQPPRF
jgi:hypothetical protein